MYRMCRKVNYWMSIDEQIEAMAFQQTQVAEGGIVKTKRCPTCDDGKGRKKPIVLFGRDPHMRDGRQGICKTCRAVGERRRRLENKGRPLFDGPAWVVRNG